MIWLNISAAMIISDRKKSPLSNRSPTMDIPSLHLSSIWTGSTPDFSISSASFSAVGSSRSTMASTILP